MNIRQLAQTGIFACICAGSWACGGAGSPAAAPEAEASPEQALAQPNGSKADMGVDESGEGEEAVEEGANAPEQQEITPDDLRVALQIVIHDEALRSALNLGEPGRFPLQIHGENFPSHWELTAESEAVKIVPAPENSKTEPVLVFTKAQQKGESITFKYRYDVEGVIGKSTVIRVDGRWELKGSRVSAY